ncbi:hypothetical protein SacmaDRAFT_1692 [Saccharomonospora marina XMU15]|uniref:Uncharacterized protein n=1 Tax=Saccharomonospora marina XMU15 TaxID=882083 RepID=H5X4G0_9PSEU|nr:hypothetical protein SacmaDRAFT_1692 [Saccharomonospora marina XMU15]
MSVNTRNAVARVARALGWWLMVLVGLLLLATVNRVTYGGGPEVDRIGTASARECVEYGPVSLHGFGTTYRCTAEVRWADGDVEQREFPAGQLSPSDVGTPVEVYLDIGDGVQEETTIGRNGSARFSELRFPVKIALGFAVFLVLGLGALYNTYRVFRPGTGSDTESDSGGSKRGGRKDDWPVTAAERAGVPIPRLVVRLRLLSAWCLLVAIAVPVSTVVRFDAERAPRFVSPWPQVGRALLVDVPAAGAVIIGLVLAVLLYATASAAHRDAARVVKYGPDYLARGLSGGEPARALLATRMSRLAESERASRAFGIGFGVALLGLAAWAVTRVVSAMPGDAPWSVWLAGARDSVLLACLALILLFTAETRYHRLSELLARHEINHVNRGTENGFVAS